METELECDVCLELFENPVLLRCSHTLCTKCATDIIEHGNKRAIECPACRHVTELPPGEGVEGLVKNRALGNVVAKYKEHKMTTERQLELLTEAYQRLDVQLKGATSNTASFMRDGDAKRVASSSGELQEANEAMKRQLEEIWASTVGAAPSELTSTGSTDGMSSLSSRQLESKRKKSQASRKKVPHIFQSDVLSKFKIVMAGPSSSGKTSLAHFFVNGQSCIEHAPTHGAKFDKLSWKLKGKPINLELWDTAGQDRQATTLAPYVREADAILMVYDITSLQSLRDVTDSFTKLIPHTRAAAAPLVFILANQADRLEAGEQVNLRDFARGEEDESEGATEDDEKKASDVEGALMDMIAEVRCQLQANVLQKEASEVDVEGLVSCYMVSAKTGSNCREVLEQLQLRLAYRHLLLSQMNPPPTDDKLKLGRNRSMSRRGRNNDNGCPCG